MSNDTTSKDRLAMMKEVEVKDDGRTLIYYSFRQNEHSTAGTNEKVALHADDDRAETRDDKKESKEG